MLVLLAAAALGGCLGKKPQFSGVDITGADYARDVALNDQFGQPRSLKDFRGKVVVVNL